MSNILKDAGRISADMLAAAAAEGVQRALAARASSLTELTADQTQQVTGAATAVPVAVSSLKLRPPIIYGLWYPIDQKTLGSLNTQQF
jgi:hypothetical protein